MIGPLLLIGLLLEGGPAPFVLSDVTGAAGIDFHHEQGASGRRYMVEIAGGGVLVFDYDVDGLPDLYFVNGAPLPGDPDPKRPNALYRNAGDGRFIDVTTSAGLESEGYGMGGSAADVDDDGDVDLFLSAFGKNHFYRNRGDGTFVEETDRAGLGDERWGTSAAFFDADADGFVDLYVANYLDFTLADHRVCVSPTGGLVSYCHPKEYPGTEDLYYRNRGDGTFENVTQAAGIGASAGGKGLGVVVSDYDDDGDSDLYIANDTTPNFLFQNDGHGRFREVALESGVAFNEEGLPEAGMGVDFGDFDRDGRLDVVVTNFDFETNTLYRNFGGGFFLDATTAAGLGDRSLTELAFGCDLVDLDNDGWLDLIVTNGHILDNIAELQSNLRFAEPGQFFWNRRGKFDDLSGDVGPVLARPRVGRGLATLDFDRDGDLDVVLSSNGGAAELLRNDGGDSGGFVELSLVGSVTNREGIGARLFGSLDGLPYVEELRTASSYLSQNELRLRVGLGTVAEVEGFSLRWPSGRVEPLPPLRARRRYVVKEGLGVIAEEGL